MSKLFKYLSLAAAGLIIIIICSEFQHVPSVEGEYHYSRFLGKNYLTIPAATIFFIVSIAIGFYWKLNPWLAGLCLFLSSF